MRIAFWKCLWIQWNIDLNMNNDLGCRGWRSDSSALRKSDSFIKTFLNRSSQCSRVYKWCDDSVFSNNQFCPKFSEAITNKSEIRSMKYCESNTSTLYRTFDFPIYCVTHGLKLIIQSTHIENPSTSEKVINKVLAKFWSSKITFKIGHEFDFPLDQIQRLLVKKFEIARWN